MGQSIKLFTVADAEKTLPLVQRILGDIVTAFAERDQRRADRGETGDDPQRLEEFDAEIARCEEDAARYLAELQQIGVQLKDVRLGLVDFFSRYNGRVVCLCWKLDEGDAIGWWHDLHSGFRGRQPITHENRALFKGAQPGEKPIELG
ncbi:MAG TPA: DUF2203 domain-containing protein [Planctomycetota bacterium]|jgi:hypothetical protein